MPRSAAGLIRTRVDGIRRLLMLRYDEVDQRHRRAAERAWSAASAVLASGDTCDGCGSARHGWRGADEFSEPEGSPPGRCRHESAPGINVGPNDIPW
jgi:hypothetical protein